MLRSFLIAFILWVVLATISEANDDAQRFWGRFREAVLKGDSGKVAAMTKLPLWVRGPDDSDPVVYYGRKDFDKVLKRLLNQEVSIWRDGRLVEKSMLQIIKEKQQLSSGDHVTPHIISVELFQFEKLKGEWLFTRGYVEDGAD